MIRKTVAIIGLVASIFAGANFISPVKAGALNHPGIACYHNYHPAGVPNVKMWCGGWFQSDGFAFRFEASHHYGYWGPNFDDGRWRVIIDKHYIPTGQHLQRTVDTTFNDQIAPWITGWNNNTQATLSFVKASETNLSKYNYTDPNCNNNYPSKSYYYVEHPQFWLVHVNGCVFGNGWKQGNWYLIDEPAFGTSYSVQWQSPSVKAWVK